MAQKNREDEQEIAAEPKFYLPAGITAPSDGTRFERLWAKIFNHSVDPSR